MGWTTPRTWVTGETETAAIFNAHVRDNLTAINGYVPKTANESGASFTALQNDNELTYTIGATGTYVVDLFILASSAADAAGDLSVGFTFPTATAARYMGFGPDPGLASGHVQTTEFVAAQAITSGSVATSYGLSTSFVGITIHLLFTFTATGTLQFQWAQASSNVNATSVLAGSHMLVRQVA